MHPKITTIIFDFGNVVGHFDYRPTFEKILPHTNLTETQILAGIALSDLEDEYETGRITSEEFVQRMFEIGQLRCEPEVLKSAWCEIFWPNADLCRLIPRLKSRYRLLLGSNTNELHALHYRQQFADVFQHFEHLIFSFEIGARKPRSEFFHACVEKAGCKAAQCLFIDDLPANIEGARACGLHGIVYRGMEDLQKQLERLGISLEQ